MTDLGIKSMKLYGEVDRIFNNLAQLGIGDDDPLTVDVLSRFDQYHYHGTDAIDEAIDRLGITAAASVLEIGSGLGGPARYLADRTGCRVTALELQPDLDELAASLTARCSLAGRVVHRCGDALTTELPDAAYDAVVSWLAVYHIPDPARLFARFAATLKPGGGLYIEDLFRHGDFSAEETRIVKEKLYGLSLPRRDAYIETLETAGFSDITFTDLTSDWRSFVTDRRDQFTRERDDNVALHGPAVVDALSEFYGTVVALFESGKLGGVRLTATKP